MISWLAMLAALLPSTGCRSLGASVYCHLAAVEAPPPVTPRQPEAAPKPDRASVSKPSRHSTPARWKHRDHALETDRKSGPDRTAPDAAEIHKHIRSLVSIGDCTGARTYASLIGEATLAEQTFRACIGQ